jgi:hypothetical protein
MRSAELISVVALVFLWLAARTRPLSAMQRRRVSLFALFGLGLIAAPQVLATVLPPLAVSVVRDWMPGLLILTVYWQAGSFFTRPNLAFQSALQQLDERLACWLTRMGVARLATPGVRRYFEAAYLLCYAIVPLGVGALYILKLGRFTDEFWLVVLPPTYLCYALLPFAPTLPPRFQAAAHRTSEFSLIRRVNLRVLDKASVQANTFPSGHVAASVAAALALMQHAPAAGAIWLWVALSIAVGSVLGRYHYALDALLGLGIALLWFWVVRAYLS